MKLKYYLRGLAVGIILTTIIITIANADNGPMTDAEVRQRALELGMVESSSIKLTDVGESTQQPTAEPEVSSESKEPTAEPEASSESKGSTVEPESSTETSQAASEQEPATESVPEPSSSKEAESTQESGGSSEAESTQESSSSAETESAPDEPVGGEPVLITIKSGDSSYTVSKVLAAAGLVEDAVEYDNYLCNNGYSRRIRTGTYEITPGMSYEEIAKMIAS